ncbi:hypothetical protein PI93_023825 [Pandoraea fibrosis]|uniref:Zinc ribbon domain-containing protein n=1 Tax=Pandoraea fibrosis TaxID=1891094 RepID=A0ABX6HWP6_9BURK|nr:zinc ribbon domain-containing protein [Pandoraea fibrosis]QHE94497.1 hypothetical protein PJ20_023820 [Pandoraea fibrosis]QHF15335.1 hypothetical protein PI93_023825 [Pandoraea fibrosis]
MQCPTCGTNNAPRAPYCVKCGAKLADAEPGFRDDRRVTGAAGAGALDAVVGASGNAPMSGARAGTAPSTSTAGAPDEAPKRRVKRERGESPGWLNGALVLGTAIFAAVALLGIWWNLRAPYVDPAPKPPGGIAVTPFGAPIDAPPTVASGNTAATAVTTGAGESEASAALARAQALAAVDAAASGAAADVAAASQPAPLTASAATAALTAAATSLAPARHDTPDDMMQLLSRRDAGGSTPRPMANADLPAHYDNNDIGPIAAEAQHQPAAASAASAPAAAATIAAALAQCERYRWYEVIPKQRCIWAVCNGRWGKDGCPAGTNPGESR